MKRFTGWKMRSAAAAVAPAKTAGQDSALNPAIAGLSQREVSSSRDETEFMSIPACEVRIQYGWCGAVQQ